MKALVVGSSDIDIFITPESKNSYVEDQKTVTFSLGDKVPVSLSAMKLGGNGANVSVGLSRLGVDVSFYTYLGDDILSQQIQETIKQENVHLVENPQHTKSSSLSLIFDFSDDRVIFSHHEELDHTFDGGKVEQIEALYLTSLGEKWTEAYKEVLSYVQSHPLTLAFSPGSHQLSNMEDLVFEMVAVSKILFVNKEEGERILEKKGEKAVDNKDLLLKLSKLGPEIVSVTDGKKGSYAYSNNTYYALSSFDEEAISTDKTGAGDSYASAFFGAVLLGKDIKTAMRWGAANAQAVMSKVGAQDGLLTESEIESMLSARPDFVTQEI